MRERRYGFPLPEPFCTITYRAFCEALFERSGAAFERARVEGREGADVLLAGGGRAQGRFVVDAAGWRRTLDPAGAIDATATGLSFGAEEHVPYPDVLRARGLHIYLRRDLVRRGYAWNFPSRDHARAGVGSYARTPLAPCMDSCASETAWAPRAKGTGASSRTSCASPSPTACSSSAMPAATACR